MTKSALRVLDIMEYIADQKNGSTHSQVAAALGIPKSSLTALLRDLVSRGYLAYDADTARFGIGSHILTLSQAFLRNLNIVKLGQPIVAALYEQTGEFSAFGIPKGVDYVIICAESMPLPLAHSLQIGERGPMFCSATGKAILAFLPPEQRDSIIAASNLRAFTAATKTDPVAIRTELLEVRAQGLAFAREENLPGIVAMAAPVFNATGQVVGAVSVATPVSRFSLTHEEKTANALKAAAAHFSDLLGWRSAA
jgi:DNA-binding IclR family transcriptional regulator